MDEDVEVGRVADGAADDADAEGEGGDGGDEVVGADDGGDDGGWDDDAADAEAGEDEEAPDLVEVVDAGDGERAAAWIVSACVGWRVGIWTYQQSSELTIR